MSGDRILITGATGLLGPYLCATFSDLDVVKTARHDVADICDLTDARATTELVASIRPHVVIHLVALTDVDACERRPEMARQVNEMTVANVVSALDANATFVYLSTDQVYPGTGGPYAETQVGAVNVYGGSKLAGEAAACRHPKTLCLRTNFFGPSLTTGRTSLSDFVIEKLSNRQPITLFADILFSPLHMETLSYYLRKALERGLTGVFNLGCREGGSKADFGLSVARHLNLPTDTATVGESVQAPGRAPRPSDMRMDVCRIEAALDDTLPTMEMEVGKL